MKTGWEGYRTSTASFPERCRPIYRKTSSENTRKSGLACVYVMEFTSIEVPTYTFLKVGISGERNIRFDFDSHRYKHRLLASNRVKDYGSRCALEACSACSTHATLTNSVLRARWEGHRLISER